MHERADAILHGSRILGLRVHGSWPKDHPYISKTLAHYGTPFWSTMQILPL